jgi:2-methylcitrate dehydratase PrpD
MNDARDSFRNAVLPSDVRREAPGAADIVDSAAGAAQSSVPPPPAVLAPPPVTLRLARFAAQLEHAALPPQVQQALTIALLDYLRVASLGERMPWSRWALNMVHGLGGQGGASLLFSREQTDPERATLVNATYAGSIDADDVHVGSMLHPGCVVISAALAMGQARAASGERILAAIAAGYETMIRIGLALQPSHFRRGFQSTATCGVFGAATAAACLAFDGVERTQRIAQTLGLAASFSGGLTQFYHSGSTVKRIHAAHAAREGVHAALLVEAGFSGPTDILEGRDGYARAYADGHDFDKALDGLGERWRLLETAVKPHACSARVLAAIEAAAALCAEHGIDARAIAQVSIGIPRIIQGRLTVNAPADIQAAQMSLPFCVAMVLEKGAALAPGFSLNVEDFEAALSRAPVRALAQQVECVLDADAERVSTEQSVGARVVLGLHSGVRLERFIEAPKGAASRPFTLDDHIARFEQELSRRLTPATLAATLDEVRGFDRSANADRLMGMLATG